MPRSFAQKFGMLALGVVVTTTLALALSGGAANAQTPAYSFSLPPAGGGTGNNYVFGNACNVNT